MKERDDGGSTNVAPSGSMKNPAEAERALFEERLRFLNTDDFHSFGRKAITGTVLSRMRQTRAGGVLVTEEKDGSRLAGIFTERDYLDKLAGDPAGQDRPIEEFMTASPRCLSPDNSVADAIRLMTDGGYRHIPLIEAGQGIAGMVSVRHIMVFISEHFAEEIFNLPPVLDQRISTQEGG